VAGSPSTEGRRPLSPAERIVGAGAIAVFASLLFPWYGIAFSNGLSVTGLDRFGFAHAALLITVGAAVFVVAREAAGRPVPRPLRGAELVMVAGTWGALLCCFLIADRPDELAGRPDVQLRYGIFVALGGCLAIVVGGMRMRAERRLRSEQ
jgi:hypothetical protein